MEIRIRVTEMTETRGVFNRYFIEGLTFDNIGDACKYCVAENVDRRRFFEPRVVKESFNRE